MSLVDGEGAFVERAGALEIAPAGQNPWAARIGGRPRVADTPRLRLLSRSRRGCGLLNERSHRRPRKRPRRTPHRQGLRLRPLPAALRQPMITPRIARRGVDDSRRLGRSRWRSSGRWAWLSCWRRLQVHDERRVDILLGFVHLACALMRLKLLNRSKV